MSQHGISIYVIIIVSKVYDESRALEAKNFRGFLRE
nr:MAG TPA: hypothetical protein [Caudoviricetes sp.]